jgi:hypothetical protein
VSTPRIAHQTIRPSGIRSSYKTTNSPSGKVMLNEDTTSNVARPRMDSGASAGLCSRTMQSSMSKRKTQRAFATDTLLPSTPAIQPSSSQFHRGPMTANFITAEEAFHCFTMRTCFSRDEMSFILSADLLGIREAIRQAERRGDAMLRVRTPAKSGTRPVCGRNPKHIQIDGHVVNPFCGGLDHVLTGRSPIPGVLITSVGIELFKERPPGTSPERPL